MTKPFQPDNFIAANVRNIPRSGIRDFFDIVQGMKDVISLGVGEPDFVTPWHIREASIFALEKGRTSYTSNLGLLKLREAIAISLEKHVKVSYNPKNQILIGIHHTYLCQKWQGIEVWNGEIAVHRGADGGLIAFHHAAEPRLGKRVNTVSPVVSAGAALSTVLTNTLPGVPIPAQIGTSDEGRVVRFDGSALGDQDVEVKLYLLPIGDGLRLVWNVNHYTPDGTHWWNVRIDAVTGAERQRNDWVSQCSFDEPACETHVHLAAPEVAPAPLVATT